MKMNEKTNTEMNTQTNSKIDVEKERLLGFRILRGDTNSLDPIGPKIGSKSAISADD